METFSWKPSPNSTRPRKPRIVKVSYGDGYTNRAPDGLQPLKEEWKLVFTNVDMSESVEIDEFLTRHEGTQAFYWTPPPPWDRDPSTQAILSKTMVCEEWDIVPQRGRLVNITASFKEETP